MVVSDAASAVFFPLPGADRCGSGLAVREGWRGPGAWVTRALDEHLGRGFDIESAADGWVLLRRRGERLVLALGVSAGKLVRR